MLKGAFVARKRTKQPKRPKVLNRLRKIKREVQEYFKLRNFDGIKLRGAYFTHHDGKEYYLRTRAALALLKEKAPKEYAIVKKYIKKIVFESNPPFGYFLETKTFKAHYNHVFSNLIYEIRKLLGVLPEEKERQLEIMDLAATIYHEAFHGLQYAQIKGKGKKKIEAYMADADKYESMSFSAAIQLLKKLGAPPEMIEGFMEWARKKPWRTWEPGQATAQIRAPRWRWNQEIGFIKLREAERKAKESKERG